MALIDSETFVGSVNKIIAKTISQIWINRHVTPAVPLGGVLEDSDFCPTFGTNGKWIVVGAHGQMIMSTDPQAANWTAVTSPIGNAAIQQIKWIPELELWIITGARPNTEDADYPVIYTSPDGATWTQQTDGLDFGAGNAISGIAYGNGMVVVCGEGGGIATSENGVNWTMRSNPFGGSHAYMVDWSGAFFLMSAKSGKIAKSADGINWALTTNPLSAVLGVDNVYVCRWCHDRFFVGTSTNKLLSTTDGETWVTIALPLNWSSSGALTGITDACYLNGVFIIVGGGSWPNLCTSYDGITFGYVSENYPAAAFGNAGFISGIRARNNMFIVVGWDGANAVLLTSAAPGVALS